MKVIIIYKLSIYHIKLYLSVLYNYLVLHLLIYEILIENQYQLSYNYNILDSFYYCI